MRITTPRLALEPISLAHLKSTHAYSSDQENTRLMMFLPYDSIEETEVWIRQSMEYWRSDAPEHLQFAVMLDGRQIGDVTMYMAGPGNAELGWILDKGCQGHGYAAEAVRAVMDYGRREWGIRRFFAMCDSENAPSYRLMERLGMRRVPGVGKRKNRSSEEERPEIIYEIYV